MTLLHAPDLSLPDGGRPRPARVAQPTDLWRIALGHSAGIAAHRPRGLRMLGRGAALTDALQLIAPIGRGEVWVTGAGTALQVTPTVAERTSRVTMVGAAAQVGLVIVFPVALAAASVWVGGVIAAIGLAVAFLYLAGLLLPLTCSVGGRSITRSTRVHVVRAGVSGRVTRLHDLVRHPGDPAGTGVALLAAVLGSPAHAADTVHAVAATERLADLYVTAGMSRRNIAPSPEAVR